METSSSAMRRRKVNINVASIIIEYIYDLKLKYVNDGNGFHHCIHIQYMTELQKKDQLDCINCRMRNEQVHSGYYNYFYNSQCDQLKINKYLATEKDDQMVYTRLFFHFLF